MLELRVTEEFVYDALKVGSLHIIESIFYDVVAQGGKVKVFKEENLPASEGTVLGTKEEVEEWIGSLN